MAAALMEDQTGPTFVSSLGDLAPGAGEGDRSPTSLVRSPSEPPPGLEADTGPTQVAPGLLDGDTGPTHISTGALDDDTGPTTTAPTMSPAAAAAASRPAPPLGEDSSRPPAARESRSPGPPAAGGAVGPSPPNQPAPWLMGGGAFPPSRSEPPPPPTSPDVEMLDSELLEAPHDEDALAGPFARTTALRNIWRAATTPIGVKILIAVGVLVAIITTVVLVWPRPQPLARLDIRSHPPGAQVFLDGEPLPGLTPTSVDELELESVHQVELRLTGFSPWSQPVRMDAERVRQIAVLSPIRGILRVTSDPPGASVYVDGVYRGVTPREVDGLDINRPVEVQARLETRSQAQTISWDGRTEATVNFVFADTTRRRRPYR